MRILVNKSQRHLAVLWFIGAGIAFFLILLQTILGRYGEEAGKIWGWLLPNTIPTLSLITGVLVTDALKASKEAQSVDSFVFWLAFILSAIYLGVLNLTILAQPFSSIELVEQSNLWLAPLQGLVNLAFGAFFVQKQPE